MAALANEKPIDEAVADETAQQARPLPPHRQAYAMVYESGVSFAREFAQLYLNEATVNGDGVAEAYWQAVIVRIGEIEQESSLANEPDSAS